MVTDFILPLSLILPGLWMLQITKVKVQSNVERLSLSYILSLTVMFGLLYIGGIIKAFNIASFIFLAIVVISSVHLFTLFIMKILRSPRPFVISLFSKISTERLIVAISAIGLLSVYVILLHSRAILDSDVVQYYLPIAREIVKGNGFTYNTGYDYNVHLKPVAVSVLYAWTFVINNSTLSEAFRLMPLTPIFMLILLNYAIAVSATKSEKIGIISTALFLVFPFHDRFLRYSAFYPDTFYYPLIFAVTYFLIEYFHSKRSALLFWAGVSLGSASLLKAQTIYFLIAFLLVFVVLKLRCFKKLSAALCIATPFYILIPSILADSIQREGIRLSAPAFTGTQLGLLLFLSTLSGVCYCITMLRNVREIRIAKPTIMGIIKRIILFLLPFVVLSSLWYMNNLFKFGTLIYTSSIDLPNYDWALETLKSLETAQPLANIWHYIVYFMFMFVDPAVMGYIMLVPLLIGLLFVLRKKLESFDVLLIFEAIATSIILSIVVLSLSSGMAAYNPRDILPMAPFLATLSAIGITSATSRCHKSENVGIFASLLLVTYFGFLSYIHSVCVWYTSSYYVTTIGNFMSILGNSLGLSLRQTSFQLPYGDRVVFVSENILRVVSLSLLAGIPIIALLIYKLYKLLTKRYTLIIRFGTVSKKVALKPPSIICSPRQRTFIKTALALSLILSVILIPRLEMLTAQGGLQELKENQLKMKYKSIYELFASPVDFEGGILTFRAPMGLPYYLPDIKIIDLAFPANLAFLKDCFQSAAPYETVLKLKQQGIRHLLINPSVTRQIDPSLNFTISKIIRNPELAILSRTFGSWQLYTLGPYNVKRRSIPLLGWDIDPRYTNANYTFESDESHLFLQLHPVNSNSRVTITNRKCAELNLSDYDYVTIKLEGTNNAQILIRFFLSDGDYFDVSYWKDPYICSTPFDLKPYFGKTLRGDVYIGLKSSDGLASSITICEISVDIVD